MLLNFDKSEVLLVSRKSVNKSLPEDVKAGVDNDCQTKLQTLGVTIDSKLSLSHHVQRVIKSCNYHVKAFRHVRHHFDKATANMVACSIVTFQLDYCNSLLYNMLEGNLN